jgi:molybdopterin/thiamine biosynthesis adenylyltransferase
MSRITIVGLGNIGSHLPGLMGRLEGVSGITLVDPDSYEPKNVPCQSIDAGDLGPKVHVQARRLRRINPRLSIRPLCARVEDVPLGLLRGDVILAALDSRASRRAVNRVAWRLNTPWIDAAVDGAGLLVRVIAYLPGPDAPCLECAYDANDYALLEQEYPCVPNGRGAPATNAPAGLGAIAAGLMALECRKLLAGERQDVLAGRQVLMDLMHHVHDVTRYRRQAGCKFDHGTWSIASLEAPFSRLALGDLFRRAMDDASGASEGWAVRLEGHSFTRVLFCPGCGGQTPCGPCLLHRLPPRRRHCPACGGEMVARGFDCYDWLEEAALTNRDRRRSLASLGFRPGDIVTVRGPGGEQHWELGGPAASARPARALAFAGGVHHG